MQSNDNIEANGVKRLERRPHRLPYPYVASNGIPIQPTVNVQKSTLI